MDDETRVQMRNEYDEARLLNQAKCDAERNLSARATRAITPDGRGCLQTSAIDELASALAKAQGEFGKIAKNKVATIRGKTKAGVPYEFSFRYADLPGIVSATQEKLSKHGLALTHLIGAGTMTSILLHESGQYLATTTPMAIDATDPFSFSKESTRIRRQVVQAMLGIAADEDWTGPPADQSDPIPAGKQIARETNKPAKGRKTNRSAAIEALNEWQAGGEKLPKVIAAIMEEIGAPVPEKGTEYPPATWARVSEYIQEQTEAGYETAQKWWERGE